MCWNMNGVNFKQDMHQIVMNQSDVNEQTLLRRSKFQSQLSAPLTMNNKQAKEELINERKRRVIN